ncbi:MAG: M28 family peptidase [Planctomycetota bacterium]|nr:MAG: M28 family peptidase [Planctomycetota bacterium]
MPSTPRTWPLLAVLVVLAVPGGDAERDAALKTITAKECAVRVETLAGPEMQGRGTPSAGLEKAARYVEEELAACGLEPAGPEGSYRLPYQLYCAVADPQGKAQWTDAAGAVQALELGTDFVPVPGSRPGAVRGVPVFAGYAIDASKEEWRDFASGKARGKLVFAFTREPRADDPKLKRFDGAEPTEASTFASKLRAVAEAGGIGLVLVPDPALDLDPGATVPDLVPLPLPRNFSAARLGQLAGWPDVPVISMSRRAAEAIFATDLGKHHADLDKRLRPKLLQAPEGVVVEYDAGLVEQEVPYFNLAARIRGSSGSGAVLILGAHLDHVGWNHGDDAGRMRIHPGADDNASGSAVLLEVAQACAALPPPQDDVLFLWFTGEERGLLGSRAYCEEPLYPHTQALAMLNMDMVARNDPRLLNVGGLWDRPEWARFLRKQARAIRSDLELDFDQGRDLYQRSDHFAFHEHNVPALFFFEGDLNKNEVYHRPGDVAETVDPGKMERIGRLFAATAYALMWEGERP